jgi:hypothetical protein
VHKHSNGGLVSRIQPFFCIGVLATRLLPLPLVFVSAFFISLALSPLAFPSGDKALSRKWGVFSQYHELNVSLLANAPFGCPGHYDQRHQ